VDQMAAHSANEQLQSRIFLKKSRLLFDSNGLSIQNNDPTLSSLDPHVLYRSSILNPRLIRPQSSLDTSSILNSFPAIFYPVSFSHYQRVNTYSVPDEYC
jgi:hypothetical protein